MPQEGHESKYFVLSTVLNLLWNFSILQLFILVVVLNFSIFFPKALPESHIFVLDSGEYIDDLHYYGSQPEEIDDNYLRQQWFKTESV